MNSPSSYKKFLQSIESSSESIEMLEKMAHISQIRRRDSGTSICSDKSSSSIYSVSSTKSAVPSALDYNTFLYQKGFEFRQFDSDEDFDQIVGIGFNDKTSTLRLTLTPELLRQQQ